ncbi:Flp1 family type IVb pilin [Guggenheimella bovis]
MDLREKGFGTVELVILTAILIGLALLFKNFIVEYAQNLIDSIKAVELDIENIGGQ